MSATTKIEWTDHTFNPWWGCARVSPACRSCYADGIATRWGHELWRRKGPRRMLSDSNWRNPLKWSRAAEAAGQPAKVFCASMADVFEVHPVVQVNAELDAARSRLWSLIEQTPSLIWQLLTKRPENVAALTPWTDAWPANVWLGTSVEDNQRATERIPELVRTNAQTLFLSCEPLLEDLDLSRWIRGDHASAGRRLNWVIAGGESGGAKARPMHPDWARSLRDQCRSSDVAFFFKQWGEHLPVPLFDAPEMAGGRAFRDPRDGTTAAVLRERGGSFRSGAVRPMRPGDANGFGVMLDDDTIAVRVGQRGAGRELDGRTWDEFPRTVS